jgi:hypothetical protein
VLTIAACHAPALYEGIAVKGSCLYSGNPMRKVQNATLVQSHAHSPLTHSRAEYTVIWWGGHLCAMPSSSWLAAVTVVRAPQTSTVQHKHTIMCDTAQSKQHLKGMTLLADSPLARERGHRGCSVMAPMPQPRAFTHNCTRGMHGMAHIVRMHRIHAPPRQLSQGCARHGITHCHPTIAASTFAHCWWQE